LNLPRRVLVTGATGYVGGRLVPRLLQAGYRVRVLVRDRARLQGRPWLNQVEVAEGDVLRPDTLPVALDGVQAAYYLVHSMLAHGDFAAQDIAAARAFGHAALQAGVQQIVYLGGLGDPQADLSEHLRSRQQTGEALREAGVPVTELRAAVIVGSGSLSFEMIRNLTERLPVMICPRWVFTRIQPIAIDDVLEYLAVSLETPAALGRIVEIGGTDVITYGDMMRGYASARGLRRLLIAVPVLTPRLSSYWVHWMTPIPAGIARPLIEGLRNEVVVRDDTARRIFPGIHPLDFPTAVRKALAQLEAGPVETTWSDALVTTEGDHAAVLLTLREGMIVERRQETLNAPVESAYAAFSRLGGETGWLYATWLWRIRGAFDRLAGGVGMRRGRRDPVDVRVGDALDFWRVEAVEPGRMLRLRAEMKVPGRAWLQFEALPRDPSGSRLVQTAFFAPRGLLGLLYWYGLYPVHALIFSGLVRRLAARSETYTAPTG
jgi:uncharacterized protein YbjT (DUF2867 family)